MTDVQSMVVRLTGDGSSYQKMMADAVFQTQLAAGQIEKYCTVIAGALASAIGGIGNLSMGEFARFDKGITESVAKMGGVSAQVREQMETIAKDLSISGKVAFSPTELAKAYEAMAAGGLNAVQSMKLLPIAATTAQAGIMDVTDATKSLMGALNTLGMASKNSDEFAENMKRMSDVVVMADDKTNTSTKYLLKALTGDGARAAREWGMSLEELVGNLSVYAQSNIEASEASNLLGRAIRLTSSAYVLHKDLWKKQNIDLIDETTGRWVTFAEAMDKVAQATKNLDDDEYIKFVKALGLKDLSRKAILPYLGASGQAKGFTEQYKTGAEDHALEKAALQMQSFSNQLQVLKNEFAVLAIDIGKVLAPVLAEIADQVREVTRWFREMSDESKAAVVMAGAYAFGAAAGFLALVAAVKIATFVFGGLVSILVIMPLQVAFNVAAWVTYKVVMLAVTAAVLTYKGIMLLANVAVGLAMGTHGAFTLIIMAMTGAVTLLNAALTITNVLLAGAAVVAATIAAGVFVTVIAGAAAALYSAYDAGKALFGLFAGTESFAGPIKYIGSLFAEWGVIISDVGRAAQVDMGLAWEMIKVGGEMAVEQIKTLWPPLWQFVVAGFSASWELVSKQFSLTFDTMIRKYKNKIGSLLGKNAEFSPEALAQYNKLIKMEEEAYRDTAEAKIGKASDTFTKDAKEATDGVKEQYKDRLEDLRWLIDMSIDIDKEGKERLLKLQEEFEAERNKTEERGRGKANLPGKVHQQIKIDQALIGSQEAFRRLEQQTDMINDIFNTWADQPEDPKLAAARKLTDELERQNNSLVNMGKSYNDILAIMEQMAITGKNIPIFGLPKLNPAYEIAPGFGIPDPNPFGSGKPVSMGEGAWGKSTEVVSILGDVREYLRKMSEHPTVELEEATV